MTDGRLHFSVFNLGEVTAYHKTPSSFLRKWGEEYLWYRRVEIEVALPRDQQLALNHPALVRRLIKDYPRLSMWRGGLKYGEGRDFLKELKIGKNETLGVVYKQVAAQLFDDTSSRLGYGDHNFRWIPRRNKKKSNAEVTVYTIYCLHEIKPPAEFLPVYVLALGYLNAVMAERPFLLESRIDDFVHHRTNLMQVSCVSQG